MNRSNCTCNCFSIFMSVLAGIAAGVLFYFRLIPEFYAAAYIAFIFAAVTLFTFILILISSGMRSPIIHDCVCTHGRCLLFSIIGTLFSTIALIAMDYGYFYLVMSVLIVSAFFFTLLLQSIANLLSCLIRNHCGCPFN